VTFLLVLALGWLSSPQLKQSFVLKLSFYLISLLGSVGRNMLFIVEILKVVYSSTMYQVYLTIFIFLFCCAKRTCCQSSFNTIFFTLQKLWCILPWNHVRMLTSLFLLISIMRSTLSMFAAALISKISLREFLVFLRLLYLQPVKVFMLNNF